MADLTPERPDIVDRLRWMSRRGYWPLLGAEAADEIGRLRADNEDVQRTWGAVAICNETLRKEVDRLRAVIRETHRPGCNSDGWGHAPTCKIYEIEP